MHVRERFDLSDFLPMAMPPTPHPGDQSREFRWLVFNWIIRKALQYAVDLDPPPSPSFVKLYNWTFYLSPHPTAAIRFPIHPAFIFFIFPWKRNPAAAISLPFSSSAVVVLWAIYYAAHTRFSCTHTQRETKLRFAAIANGFVIRKWEGGIPTFKLQLCWDFRLDWRRAE
jgi:hypothetical protein